MAARLVLTDLDHTLLEADGSLSPEARAALDVLAARGIPLVPLTSKTESELRAFLESLGLAYGVFENGAGLITPEGLEISPAAVPAASLGTALASAASDARVRVKTLGAHTDAELTALTGLTGGDLERARERRFGVPFLVEEGDADALLAVLSSRGVRTTRGGRFFHVSGNHDKGDFVPSLGARFLGSKGGEIAGFGDAPNDAAFLLRVDRPVIVPRANGPDPELLDLLRTSDVFVAPWPAGRGFAAALAELLS
ncbi:MAG: HAD hydrolase family protein [Acidobacteria bacterium]|nr:HAD hydrolase family protein [Acidobacteriota bacterium]